MRTTRSRRLLRWSLAAALLSVVPSASLVSLAQQQETKKDVLYYRRVKIDTDADHVNEQPGLKNYLDNTYVMSGSPDSVQLKVLEKGGMNYPGATWKISPVSGTAVWRLPVPDDGGLDVTWTVPPEILVAGQDVTISIRVSATGKAPTGGAQFSDSPAERFEFGSEKTVRGQNPWTKVQAGLGTGGYVPKGEGSVTLRPRKNMGGAFVLKYTLTGSGIYSFDAHYHYEPLPAGSVPPTQPPDTGQEKPPPSKGCDPTFGKEWHSTWGKFIVRLGGNRVSGTYTNRIGSNGPGSFTGTVSGKILNGDWKDDSGKAGGTFRIVLSDDGCSFSNAGFTVKPPPPTPLGPGAGPSGTDPRHGGGPSTEPTDPGSDPVGQGCIDQWLRLAMSIRNRRDKSNPAPNGLWRVSEYGQLVGHGVSFAGPPDGWETTYHRNRYAYVWATWQQAHTRPDYEGELPALKDYVEDCRRKHGGGRGGGGGSGPSATGYPPNTDPTTPMTLLAENRTVLAGGTVLVPVWLVNAADVANINFTVGYDGNVARPEGEPGKGNLLGEALFSANPTEAGLIRLGFAQSKGLSGTGNVAYLPFRAVGKPGDRTPLHLDVQIINNPGGTLLTIARLDGSITIVGPDGLVPGDCDGDGALTAVDAKCALDMSVELIPEKPNMDMDGDSQVTSRDATIILQRRAYFLAKGGK